MQTLKANASRHLCRIFLAFNRSLAQNSKYTCPKHACWCAGEHLRYLNKEVRTRNHQASDEGFLDVRIPVAALETFEMDPDAVSLHLLDTPGPNEFGEEALKHQVSTCLP